jgi:hypothetical protein
MRATLNCPSMGPSFFYFWSPAKVTTTGNKENLAAIKPIVVDEKLEGGMLSRSVSMPMSVSLPGMPHSS